MELYGTLLYDEIRMSMAMEYQMGLDELNLTREPQRRIRLLSWVSRLPLSLRMTRS